MSIYMQNILPTNIMCASGEQEMIESFVEEGTGI